MAVSFVIIRLIEHCANKQLVVYQVSLRQTENLKFHLLPLSISEAIAFTTSTLFGTRAPS
jgi:hypothetical protein